MSLGKIGVELVLHKLYRMPPDSSSCMIRDGPLSFTHQAARDPQDAVPASNNRSHIDGWWNSEWAVAIVMEDTRGGLYSPFSFSSFPSSLNFSA